jgi:NAD(P)-dependent dehydrogenase (short-subunit alcohol dehydrogenase family)
MSVDFSVAGKVAIVTGGSKGIGRAIALALAEHGADVTIAARGEEALASTKAEIEGLGRRCLAVSANMAKEEDWSRLVDQTIDTFGGVDILVNGAAVASGYGPIESVESKRWDLVMKVNLKAPWALSSLCLPSMRARGGGSIIHITSNEGLRPTQGMGAYSLSKGALVTLTQLCGKEWAPYNVRVNCIAPGLVRTEMAAPLIEHFATQGRLPNPMKRIGEPDDIAGIALYLASGAGVYATGQNFTIDGGELVLAPTDQL